MTTRPKRITSGSTGLSIAARASLKLWLRADLGVTADAGGRVSAWADQSGGGNGAAASGSDRPTLIVGHSGKPAIKFAAGQTLASASNAVPTNSPRTVFVVIRNSPTNPPASAVVFQFRASGQVFGCAWWYASGSGVPVVYTDTATTAKSIPTGSGIDIAAPSIYELSWDGNTNNNIVFALNGVRREVVTSTGVLGIPSDTGTAGYKVASQSWSGEISAIAVFDSVLSDADRAEVTPALAREYRIQS